MIDRRQVLTMGGLLGALVPGTEVAAEGAGNGVGSGAGQMSDRYAQDAVTAIKAISTAIIAQQSFDAIAPIRLRQLDFLKGQGKFPDFIDVSTDVWMGVYDWHVRFQQPLMVSRDVQGRYSLIFGFTALMLRSDVLPGFVSTPYDNR